MAVLNWNTQRAAQLQISQEKAKGDTFTDTLMNLASTVTSAAMKEGEPPLLTALSLLFEEIQSQKRRTGSIKPANFVSTLRRENGASTKALKFCVEKKQVSPGLLSSDTDPIVLDLSCSSQ